MLVELLDQINGIVWGPITCWLIGLTGLYLMVGLRFMPLRRIGFGFRHAIASIGNSSGEGDVTAFQALNTSLAAMVGTGNVAGVATAIAVGGPGSLFWMWMIALVGMATKYAESVLAVHYRQVNRLGDHVGGPMYFIRNGLGPRWTWLGVLFSLFGILAGFGIGNSVQAHELALVLHRSMGVPELASGLVMAAITYMVLVGGIRRLGKVSEVVVPLMIIVYVVGGGVIVLANFDRLPMAIGVILSDAFTGQAVAGGALGVTIQKGVARGIFSNEAGLGTAPIAQAAARPADPVLQGSISMIGTFIDTIVVCSVTGLVVVMSGTWESGQSGVALAMTAFDWGMPGGQWLVTFSTVLFTATTILAWGYYSERCQEFLFGLRTIKPFRYLFAAAVVFGAISSQEGPNALSQLKATTMVWTAADIFNALMALPNLIGLLLLSGTLFALTRSYNFEPALATGEEEGPL